MADGRSESDSLTFSSIVWQPDLAADVRGKVVGIHGASVTSEALREWASKGVRGVLIRSTLNIQPFGEQIEGLTAVRIRPEAFEYMIPASRIEQGVEQYLPFTVELRTRTEFASNASAMNVFGMVPGSDPNLRNELVVVFANLDGFGSAGELQLTDGGDLATSAVAFLEAARILAELQRWSHPLKRTVLFALVSGSFQRHAGLRALLKHPPWAAHAIRVFIDASEYDRGDDDSEQLITDAGYAYTAVDALSLRKSGVFQPRSEIFTPEWRREAIVGAGRLARAIVQATIRESEVR